MIEIVYSCFINNSVMEYLLIPDSVAQMNDGLGNACHFLKPYTQVQSTLLTKCAKAKSQKLTELSGHSKADSFARWFFSQIPRIERHNISFVHWGKHVTLLPVTAVKLKKTEKCQNGLKFKFIPWPICLTNFQYSTSEDPQTPWPLCFVCILIFSELQKKSKPTAFMLFFLPHAFSSPTPLWHKYQTETTLLPMFNHRMIIFQHNRGAVCALSFTAFLQGAIYFLPFVP